MNDADATEEVCATVRAAYERATPIEIVGGASRRHLGRIPVGERLALSGHTGIVRYDPDEYVISVRSGTPIVDLEAAISAHGQRLAAELPRVDQRSTVGGAVALGLTGPSRPYLGSLRDAVLGAGVVTGTGQLLRFGGQVLKNVAGFDVSRLMVGAYGTLGVVMDVTLRLAPRIERETVRALDCSWSEALAYLSRWTGYLPLTGACYHDGRLRVRLGGRAEVVEEASGQVGGENEDGGLFTVLRDLRLDSVFENVTSLWRLLVPVSAPLEPSSLIVDWGGAQRFWATPEPAAKVREAAASQHGQAMHLFGTNRNEDVWASPRAPTMALLGRVKAALDPHDILNRGRLYSRW